MGDGPGRQVRWQELSKSECFGLLAREHLGRVAVVDDRGPMHPWAPGAKAHYVRILPAALTGRRICAPGGPFESARRTQRSGP